MVENSQNSFQLVQVDLIILRVPVGLRKKLTKNNGSELMTYPVMNAEMHIAQAEGTKTKKNHAFDHKNMAKLECWHR